MSKEFPCIMVIEDEPLLLDAITRKIKLGGLETIGCSSAKQAFDYLKKPKEVPDAVWLDYYLEDMNGLEFMSKLRGMKKYKDIPVIVISNSATPDKVRSMLALGAKEYLLKAEHRLDDIIEIIKKFIIEN